MGILVNFGGAGLICFVFFGNWFTKMQRVKQFAVEKGDFIVKVDYFSFDHIFK
jgi:hypothetical protein